MSKSKLRSLKPRRNSYREEVLVPLDRETVEEIIRLSQTTQFSPKQMVRWLTWLGRKTMGRTILIKEGDQVMEISLEEFKKISKDLDLS